MQNRGSYQSQDRMISLLLKNNVDPTIKNKAGLLPVELLLPNSSCVALLQETKENKGNFTYMIIRSVVN